MENDQEWPDLDHLAAKLNDLDPLVRQDAAAALGDHCPKDHPAVDVLIERLGSVRQTFHDRACAAWALGQIGDRPAEVVPILLLIIEGTTSQPDANELRHHAANAIEHLTDKIDVLAVVAQHCLRDQFWKCRMHGLYLAERLIQGQSDVRDDFVPLIESLVNDELSENRENSRRILIAAAKVE